MQLIVIFSYNRAIQLDYLLKSIMDKFIKQDYKIAIIYHTSGNHENGYRKLKEKYKNLSSIQFLERKKQIFNVFSYFNTFYNIRNVVKYLKFSYLFNRHSDNFKKLLENLLETTDCEFVMFNTDDGYYFNDVIVQDIIYDKIRENPMQVSYRLYVGDNLEGFPEYIKSNNNNYYEWNYYKKSSFNHWTCLFAVDGTIYHTKSILKILKRVPYHNPVTLEAFVYDYAKSIKVLAIGLSPIKSSLVGTKLNRVSICSLNPTIDISPEFLNSKFVADYKLKLKLPFLITNANVVPLEVALVKDNQEDEIIYKLDDYGLKVQNALGPEGTKYIV